MRGKINRTSVAQLPLNSTLWSKEVPGFGVRRQRRTPVFILRKQGRQIVLGQFPMMSVDEARDAAIDRLRTAKAIGSGTRFRDIADLYLAAGDWRPKSRSTFERHLLEDCRSLAERRFAEIDREEIADLLREIQKRGSVTRNRVRATLSALWTFAIAEGKAELNVVKGTNRADERSRDRVLSREEIAALWHGLPSGRYGDIVRLLLLTAQRRQEIAGLRRSEIILDAEPRLVLPAERTKSSRAHSVPLAPAAISILLPYLAGGAENQMPAFSTATNDSAVFAGFAAFSRAKDELDAKLGIAPPFVLHDLRRSAASWIAELGFGTPWIVEAILNHAKPSIAGIYNKASYQREMRSALTQWADFVEGLAR
jgi:integrase